MFALIWGTIRLFTIRAFVPEDSVVFEEDFWSFGQLVPVLLLFVPLLLVAESCSGRHSSVLPHKTTSLTVSDRATGNDPPRQKRCSARAPGPIGPSATW